MVADESYCRAVVCLYWNQVVRGRTFFSLCGVDYDSTNHRWVKSSQFARWSSLMWNEFHSTAAAGVINHIDLVLS